MSKKRTLRVRVLALVMLLPGLAILGYLWKVLGDRGAYADAVGTSGYTSGSEAALIVVGLLLITSSVVLFIVSILDSSVKNKQ